MAFTETGEPIIAFDYSARTVDVDGRLHISKSHISKACVNPYYGREIPDPEKKLGLVPDKIYYMLRHPDELAKGAPTFARLPILAKHVPISSASIPQDLIVGAIGSDVEFNFPYLDADLCFWTDASIAGIETKQVRELSCAYRYVAIMVPGIYEGQSYDGVMTDIIGNHLAQVESGRAGSDVFAADSQLEIKAMKMTKLGNALVVALGGLSPKIAQDAALPALVGELTPKTLKANRAAIQASLVAMDAEAAEKCDKVMDGFGEEDPEPKEPKAKDKKAKDSKGAKDDDDMAAHDSDDDEEEKKKKAADKKAKDSKETDEKVEKAMDSMRKELRDANEARNAVRSIVGEVIAQDSAESIYEFALDEMKVDHSGVTQLAGLKSLFTLAHAKGAQSEAPKRIAMDAAGVTTQFPNAMRFKQA